jgi:hypothetical protein
MAAPIVLLLLAAGLAWRLTTSRAPDPKLEMLNRLFESVTRI